MSPWDGAGFPGGYGPLCTLVLPVFSVSFGLAPLGVPWTLQNATSCDLLSFLLFVLAPIRMAFETLDLFSFRFFVPPKFLKRFFPARPHDPSSCDTLFCVLLLFEWR